MIWSSGKYGLWVWILVSLLYYAEAQLDGYVSIDCGATAKSTDTDTGIIWTTDDLYISSGINRVLSSVASITVNEQQVQTLRFFPPSRNKYCYNLPASTNASYLLRATFLHGGFDIETDNSFEFSIDSTIAESLTWTASDVDTAQVLEYMVAAKSNIINFCLLPSIGNAFINTLELRPLHIGMYDVVFNGRYLKTLIRLNCGATLGDPPIRYPDDIYDRVWATPGSNYDITTTKTSSSVTVPDYDFDKPPEAVMQTAWVSTSSFWWSHAISSDELAKTTTFYLNHFLADITSSRGTRIMDMRLNGKMYLYNITIDSTANQIFLKDRTLDSDGANFTFTAATDSTLGPILNGGEIYASRETDVSSTIAEDVNALEVVKSSLGLSSWTGDPCTPVPHDWLTCEKGTTLRIITINLSRYNLTGTIPSSIAALTALTDVWLDNNAISGSIPDLSTLTKLKTLHLQDNNLSGEIPSTLASLPILTELFLSNNNLSGVIPEGLSNRNGLNLQTDGNPQICVSAANCVVGSGGGGGGSIGAIIGGVAGGVVAILIIGFLVWYYCSRHPRQPTPGAGPLSVSNVYHQTGPSVVSRGSKASSGGSSAAAAKQARAFTLAEVQEATKGYKKKIGEGGFGPVYYGKLSDGTEVAVKVNSETSGQGTTEFINEVSLLSRVHHKNLVSLLGYCEENGQQILIYEYMSNGTLREHLYGKDMTGAISWKERLDIALNAAKGLEYLHNDCMPKIIHRDIKSNNILLNDKLLAKMADFGISKLAPDDDQNGGVSTVVKGTTGYLDPEYYSQNKLTHKSDVYSFGVVLLEIICGRPPNSASFSDPRQYNLVEWARGKLNGNDLDSIVDPAIRNTYNVEAIWKVAELAMGCIEPAAINRPDMKQVVRGLTVAAEFEEQKTQSVYEPSRRAGVSTFDVQSNFNTESSYPSTQNSVFSASDYPTDAGYGVESPSAPRLITPSGTFARLPSDSGETDSSWIAPKPR